MKPFELERFLRGPSRYAAEPSALVRCARCGVTAPKAARLARELIAPLELDGEPRAHGDRLVIPCPRPDLGRLLVAGMNTVLGAARQDRELAGRSTIGALLSRWWSPLEAARLAIVARDRSIPVWWPIEDSSWLVLGLGRKSRWYQRCYFSEDAGRDLADDKLTAAQLLKQAGLACEVPVRIDGVDGCVRAAEELGYPVVVKPNLGYAQIGVFAPLLDSAAVAEAARRAQDIVGPLGGGLLLERYFQGKYVRATLVGGKLQAALVGEVPWVQADGVRSAEALIRKGLGLSDGAALNGRDRVVIEALLITQGLDANSVPAAGGLIRGGHANNGEVVDVLHCLPDQTRVVLEQVARLFASPVLGIDLIVEDPATPFDPDSDVILEVNPAPAFACHERTGASGQALASLILDTVVTGDGRVPVVAGSERSQIEALASALRRAGLWPAGYSGGCAWSGDPTQILAESRAAVGLLRLDRRADCLLLEVDAATAEEGLIVDRIDFAQGRAADLLNMKGIRARQHWSVEELVKACQ